MVFGVEKQGMGIRCKGDESHISSQDDRGDEESEELATKKEIMQWKANPDDASCISRVIASQKKGETRFLLKLTRCELAAAMCRVCCSSRETTSVSLIAYFILEHFFAACTPSVGACLSVSSLPRLAVPLSSSLPPTLLFFVASALTGAGGRLRQRCINSRGMKFAERTEFVNVKNNTDPGLCKRS